MLHSIPKKTLLILSLLLIRTEALADNAVTIEQVTSGNSNSIAVSVEGSNKEVNFSFGGASNTVDIDQKGDNSYVGYTSAWGSGASWGGDLDGDSNNLNVTQTCNQSPCGGDKFEFHIAGNSNDVDFYQGHRVDADGTLHSLDDYEYGGNQSLDLTTNGDNHDVEIIQKNTGDHTATISLTNSGGAYEFQLLQDSTTDQTVTVSGTCVTTTGCPVSITQSD